MHKLFYLCASFYHPGIGARYVGTISISKIFTKKAKSVWQNQNVPHTGIFFARYSSIIQYDMPEITVFGCGNMTRLVRRAHMYTQHTSLFIVL